MTVVPCGYRDISLREKKKRKKRCDLLGSPAVVCTVQLGRAAHRRRREAPGDRASHPLACARNIMGDKMESDRKRELARLEAAERRRQANIELVKKRHARQRRCVCASWRRCHRALQLTGAALCRIAARDEAVGIASPRGRTSVCARAALDRGLLA